MSALVLCPHELSLVNGLAAGSMCELGVKRNNRGTYKQFFEDCGFRHVCIDLNGAGDLTLDLTKPIDVQAIGGPFDVVTNYGTTEHVDEQEPCWRNVHALTKVGGHLVSTTPLDWPGHGRWYPPEKWYREFAELNGYEVELFFIEADRQGGHMACMRARKSADESFTFPSTPIIEMSGGKTGAYL